MVAKDQLLKYQVVAKVQLLKDEVVARYQLLNNEVVAKGQLLKDEEVAKGQLLKEEVVAKSQLLKDEVLAKGQLLKDETVTSGQLPAELAQLGPAFLGGKDGLQTTGPVCLQDPFELNFNAAKSLAPSRLALICEFAAASARMCTSLAGPTTAEGAAAAVPTGREGDCPGLSELVDWNN